MAVLEATPIIIKPEDHLGLAHAVASQFVRPTDEVKDTEQYSVACYCLVKAAKEYDEAVGPFSTFAWRAMRNGIIEHLRRKNRKKRRADFETGYDLEQVVDTADSDLLPVELLLEILLADHPDKNDQDREDKRLLEAVYLCNRKVPELATEYGITRQMVYLRLRRCINRIRDRHRSLIEKYKEAGHG